MGGARAVARGSGEVRTPRGSRIFFTPSGSRIVASTRIRCPQAGHFITSISQLRFMSVGRSMYLDVAKSSPSPRRPQCLTEITVGSTTAEGSMGCSRNIQGVEVGVATPPPARAHGSNADGSTGGTGTGGTGAGSGEGVLAVALARRLQGGRRDGAALVRRPRAPRGGDRSQCDEEPLRAPRPALVRGR